MTSYLELFIVNKQACEWNKYVNVLNGPIDQFVCDLSRLRATRMTTASTTACVFQFINLMSASAVCEIDTCQII